MKLILTGKFVNSFDGQRAVSTASVLLLKKLIKVGFTFSSPKVRHDFPFVFTVILFAKVIKFSILIINVNFSVLG